MSPCSCCLPVLHGVAWGVTCGVLSCVHTRRREEVCVCQGSVKIRGKDA